MKKFDAELKILKSKGIRPSYIRVRILNYLLDAKIHPTVDEIYEKMGKEILTLSKTTVYNTLKLLAEKGLAKAINIEGNELRYEAERGFHGHFKCESCNSIYDIAVAEIAFMDNLEGYLINDKQVLITGLCPECNN
ncbi:MAG: Fur family transcriptional regulator [Bacillota bacterium]